MSSSSSSTASKLVQQLVAAIVLVLLAVTVASEAKLLRMSRNYDEPIGFDGPYGRGPVGERAIVTIRGARHPYDGSAPNKLIIEDNPYRGPYPRGVYDRLDGGYGRGGLGLGGIGRMPIYPPRDYGYSNYGGYNNGYNNGGYGGSMFGAPSRIAVTGAYPYGYGSRFAA